MNLHAFLHAMLKWNLVLPFKCDKHIQSLLTLASWWDFPRRNPDRKKALEYFSLTTSGLGSEVWDGSEMMWIDVFPWLVAPFHLAIVASSLRSLIWRKKDFKQPSLSHTSMDKMFFCSFFHHTHRLFISALEKLPKTEKELYRGVSCRFLELNQTC